MSSQPLVTTYTTSQGLRVLHIQDFSPIVYAGFGMAAGSAQDPTRYYGMAHLVEHMLFKGTKKRTGPALTNRVEEVGADINAFTTKEDTFVHAAFHKKYTHRVLHVLADIVLHSQFPSQELLKERGVILEEINSYEDSPSETIFDEFEERLLRGAPEAHNILGTEGALKRITPQGAKRFLTQYYHASNMVFCVQGDVEIQSVLEFLEYAFTSAQPRRDYFSTSQRRRGGVQKSPFLVVHNKQTAQAHCIVGGLAPSLQHPLRLPMALLTNMLGGPALNSSLNRVLREEHGLVYSVEASYTPLKSVGLFAIYMGCNSREVQKALDLTHSLLDELCTTPIDPMKLEKAKKQIFGQLALASDSRESSFLSAAKNFLHLNRYVGIDEMVQKLQKVTPKQIQEVAHNFLLRSHRNILIYK